jgi:hypothetical protein
MASRAGIVLGLGYPLLNDNPVGFIDYLGLRSCDEIQKHRKIVDDLLNKFADGFAQGGACAGTGVSLDWSSTIENTNLAIGVGIEVKTLGGVLDGATTQRYGARVYSGASRALSLFGKLTEGIGIGYDSYQAVNAFSRGDFASGIADAESAGLGTIGLLIAGSNPLSATLAAGGAIAIGVGEQVALAYIDKKDQAAVKSYCQGRNELFQDALDKSASILDEEQKGCCN